MQTAERKKNKVKRMEEGNKEEDFYPVDPEERVPFEETDTGYKQLQLNMNQGIKGI